MEEPESGGIGLARCVKHPSQVLTGICSLCLAERLSGVESSGGGRVGGSQIEIAELSPPRARKTLLSLFELDDLNSVQESTITDVRGFGVGKDEVLKESGVLDSPFAERGSMWGLRSASKRTRKVECGAEDREVGRSSKHVSRPSCDWTICRDYSGKASWEEPRHSWDGGSRVSRAFICSFACLHEPQDGSCGMRRELPDEVTDAATGNSELSSADNVVACEKASSSNGSVGGILRERHHDEINGQVPVSGIDRKKSNRWTRMLDWSVTSPFRDLAKRRERMLDRSLSESWREGRKDRSVVATELDGPVRFHGNGHVSTSTSHSSNRSMNSVSGDQSNTRLDRQKKKEFRFGRSRSVHYSSPGNLESGLLRFYLTPLRSSRRSKNIGRGNKSHSFARSIFGLN